MLSRRKVLYGSAVSLALAGIAGVAGTLRLHKSPHVFPHLTEEHLSDLSARNLDEPSVLFIGNSMVVQNDLPGRVAALAISEGVQLTTASASANGARLTETIRTQGLDGVLAKDWNVLVVQDFTKTPLRANDRWASARAVRHIAQTSASATILLYPPFPSAAENGVYRDAGRLTITPTSPQDYAARTLDHYERLGHRVAPVPQRWLEAIDAGQALYDRDGHHPNEAGTDLVARVIWGELKVMLGLS